MTALRFEDVAGGNALFLALVRGRHSVGETPDLASSAAAAAARELPREALAEAIVARLRVLGASEASLANAERLRRPATVVVVGGQQPVLFGGPHLVLSKVLTVVAAARALEAAGRPAVPVFWVASEDHDHAEVDHVELTDRAGAVHRLAVPLPGDRRMLSRVEMPAAVSGAHARLAALLPDGPGRDDVLRWTRPSAGDDVGTAFSRALLAMFGALGVVVVEPETLRSLASDVVRFDALRPGAVASSVAEAERAAATAGFDPPLGVRPRPVFFVVDRSGKRHRPQGLPAADDAAGRAKWLARIDANPAGFSWDVVARILAQDTALPVAAQVCGPAEFAYASMVGPAHALLGVPRPALLPRRGITFVDDEAAAACDSAGVAAADVVAGRVPPPAGAGALRPLGGLQERTASALPWIARGGSGIVGRALEAISRPDAEHVLLEVPAA